MFMPPSAAGSSAALVLKARATSAAQASLPAGGAGLRDSSNAPAASSASTAPLPSPGGPQPSMSPSANSLRRGGLASASISSSTRLSLERLLGEVGRSGSGGNPAAMLSPNGVSAAVLAAARRSMGEGAARAMLRAAAMSSPSNTAFGRVGGSSIEDDAAGAGAFSGRPQLLGGGGSGRVPLAPDGGSFLLQNAGAAAAALPLPSSRLTVSVPGGPAPHSPRFSAAAASSTAAAGTDAAAALGGSRSSSPVVSPRVALDSRVLTRVLRSATDALSSPRSGAASSPSTTSLLPQPAAGGATSSPPTAAAAVAVLLGSAQDGAEQRGRSLGSGSAVQLGGGYRAHALRAATGGGAPGLGSEPGQGAASGAPDPPAADTLSIMQLARRLSEAGHASTAAAAGGADSPGRTAASFLRVSSGRMHAASPPRRASTTTGATASSRSFGGGSMSGLHHALEGRDVPVTGSRLSGTLAAADAAGSSGGFGFGFGSSAAASAAQQPTGVVEVKSLLAQRLAAMNDALRALGASET